jgi:hypothetical protein
MASATYPSRSNPWQVFRGDADITDDFHVKDDEGKGAATATWRYRPVRVIRDFNTGKRNRVTPRQAPRV